MVTKAKLRNIGTHSAGVVAVDMVRGKSFSNNRLMKFVASDVLSEYVLRDTITNSISGFTEAQPPFPAPEDADPTSDNTDMLLGELTSIVAGVYAVNMFSGSNTSFANAVITGASAIAGRWALESLKIVEKSGGRIPSS